MFIHKLFEKTADRMRDTIALSMGGRVLTYGELENLSNKISYALMSEGVGAGDIVGVCLKRSPELVATVLAILKSGAAYLPLDPEYPSDRLKYMVTHSRVRKIIAHEKFTSIFNGTTASLLTFEKINLDQFESSRPEVNEAMIDLAYVIYTSGSTGNPKGVSLGHAALVNLIEWQNEQTIFKTNSVTLQFTPLSFDVHFQEIFSTLTLGGHLVMISEELRLDTYELLKTLSEKHVNRLFLPYVALNHLSEIAVIHNLYPDSLKEITTAGEQLKITPNIRAFFNKIPGAVLYNHYGPSETHVVTSLTLSGNADSWPNLPTIGQAIANVRVLLLDENLNPVATGSEGDIYLGGVCLANGYLHSPELTAERFLQSENLGRIYKTGDIGYIDTDGNIVFLGRKDGQVKIRGYRIELGEVEIAIMKQRSVDRAVVKVIDDESENYICAYVTGNTDIGKLREALRTELPEYMVPSHFLKIDSIPLTPSGKVDYKALPIPGTERPDLSVEFVQAESPTELFIERCWKKYIRIQKIGIDDNFFDLGGTSLMAIKILIDINQVAEKKLTVVHLFQYATIRQIANFIDTDQDELDNFLGSLGENTDVISGDIAVIGMTGRFPGAKNIDEFWNNLVEVKNNIEIFDSSLVNPAVDNELTEDSNYVFAQGAYPGQENFDNKFFGMTPREAELMDPQQRKFLELTHEGLELAGYNPESYKGSIGIFAGMGNSKYSRLVDQYPEKAKMIGDFNVMLGLEKDYIATRVAFKLNLKGPALSIHTACSTSLVAIIEAVKNLRVKNCDMALAGGIAISGAPNTGHLFQEGGILSKNGECRSFDNEATGTIFTDGGGVVVLKRLSDAERDGDSILAVIKGVGINNDGSHKMSFTAPSVMGQAEAILRAQKDAGVSADSIGFIEAHGTATPVGDPIEVEALIKAFRKSTDLKNYCYLGSLKSNMGHLTGAAGVASFMKAVKVVNTGIIPGTVHYTSPNKMLDLDSSPFIITNKTEKFPESHLVKRAGISSFGVGGTNAHIIIEEYKKPVVENTTDLDETSSIFKLSAKSAAQLELMQKELLTFLQKSDVSIWKKIAYTLETGRKEYKFRSYIAGNKPEDLNRLTVLNSGKGEYTKLPSIYFMFPGQGSHYKQMGKGLYATSGIFKEIFDQCCDLLNKHISYNIKDLIFDESSEENLNNTFYSQPAIFIIEYSLAMTLKSLGITPKAYIGHSIGEFVAATLNGVFSLEDGLRAISKRAELMKALPVGMMLSVSTSEEKLKEIIGLRALDIAAVNGSMSCVVAGAIDNVNAFKKELADLDIASIELKTSHAFHSRMMKPAVGMFLEFLKELPISKPMSPMYSTVTTKMELDLFGTPEYWANHIIDTVQFSRTIAKVLATPNILLLEVGTKNILTNLAKKEMALITGSDTKIVTLLSGNKAELENLSFNKALGDLWLSGIKVSDSRILFAEVDRKKVVAPVYIFEETKLWLEPKNKKTLKTLNMSETINRNGTMNTQLTSLQNTLVELFERSSGIEVGSFDNDTTFLEMGMDSLFLTQVALLLKKELKTTVTFRQLMEDYGSINLLANHLVDKVEVKVAAPVQVSTPAPIAAPVVHTPVQPTQAVAPVQQAPVQQQQQQRVIIPTMAPVTSGSGLESIINRQLELMSQQIMLLSGNQISTTLSPVQNTEVQMQIPAAMSAAPQVQQAQAPAVAVAEKKGKVSVTNVKDAFGAQARISTEKTAQLTDAQNKEIKNFFEQYTAKTKGSKKFTQDNRKNHADPRVVTGFKPESKEVVYPIVVKKSYLQTLWDIDDNKYIDMTCGFGSNFFGNGNEIIKKHVLKQIEDGIELGPQHPLVAEVSNMINEMTGNERTAFCNTGSEAVLGAMRIARTVTGREKIIVFSGSYHGINDEVILRGSKSGKSFPAAPGINGEAVSNMIVLDYGTAESLQIIREMAGEVAAVLVEPVQSRRCNFHPVEFLKEVRKITLESQTCLIFDEIITGFRVHPAGAQGYFGIRADLCTYGKIVGGGMPIGVVSGKSEYMDALDGGHWQYGDDSTPTVGVTYFAGTFVRHPLALAAAKGALEILKEGGVERLDQLNKKAQKFADDLNLFLLTENAPIEMNNFGPLMKPKWNADITSGDLLFAILRYNGVHVYDGFPWFINLAHTDQELAEVLNAFKSAVKTMQKMGLFPVNANSNTNEINLDPKVFDQKGAPMVGAKIGRDEKGNPAWFVEDPENAGEYYLLKG
ncbi:amino acid adenylation domain-containing protein [Bacteriovorax sp. PP10]|uniref:Amino acid adenylation domain-containing protein n=1 Tax=Bacteriovorax antarcticus TaxID=3088717 RepID=A0ABU5VS15_9BACT|nr:polyketide synthase [Bacteriovorax sp. PP10]MEA9355707.1 amino acid adenylation domain-containing protein [Bacteriovorax sp. PP10]